jgi:hypothetical protein
MVLLTLSAQAAERQRGTVQGVTGGKMTVQGVTYEVSRRAKVSIGRLTTHVGSIQDVVVGADVYFELNDVTDGRRKVTDIQIIGPTGLVNELISNAP